MKTFTSAPENLGAYGALTTEDGRSLIVARLRAGKGDEAIVRFEGVKDRNAAETLKGQRLYVPRDALPAPDKGEYYQADLVGLRVEDVKGAQLGTVAGVHNFGAGDVIEIKTFSGEREYLPFNNAAVPVVDIEGGRIVAEMAVYEEDE